MNTREKVLAALEKEKGSYLSGEALAQRCKVSRTAIWKSISELKESGYAIQSVNNRGYMLEERSDIISRTGICMYLGRMPDGKLLLKKAADKIHIYEELDSTNTEAKRSLLLSDDRKLHGTVIIAKRQTAGRGHTGSRFASPEGGVYLSILLDAGKIADTGLPVTDRVSAAVCTVLEAVCRVPVTKGPDSSLYAGQDKVCGILTEGIADLETGIYSTYIVGVGIWMKKLPTLQDGCHQKNELIASLLSTLARELGF